MKRVRDDEAAKAPSESKHFRQSPTVPQQLPIAGYKNKLLAGLEKNKVILVSGGTGCGKTTQIPQYIYDEYREKGKYVKIAVTQPRRIAAIGAAKRVCWERKCELPSPIGYAVSLDNNAAPDTAITFMTTGILVEIATSPGELSEYTHIIIDEIHERDVDIDIMLSVLRDRLSEDNRLRVILMSATIDFQLFGKYFNEKEILPITLTVLGVDGSYNVHVRYLNSVLSPSAYDTIVGRLKLKSTFESTSNDQDNQNLLPNAVLLDDIAKGACAKIVEILAPTCPATIIVFLPGVDQIHNFKKLLYNSIVESGGDVEKWRVLSLHSNGCVEDQRDVLLDPPSDKVRVVLSTNIAESSLTIKGVKFVFDFCLTKTGYTDPDTTFESLRLEWACKSQCKQRAGRTGRLNDGVVFRLVPEETYSRFQEHVTPEMVRCCVESLILKCKRLSSDSPSTFFRWVIERPKPANVTKAISNLKQIGALSLYAYNPVINQIIISEQDGNLTPLGLVMTKLPLSPRLVYLILLGRAFGVVDTAIEAAAALSIKQMYKAGSSDKVYTYSCKLETSGSWESEIYANVNAYKKFLEEFPGGFANQHHNRRRQEWADENGVYLSSMSDMFKLVEKIRAHMKHKGFYLTVHNISEFPTDTKMMFMKLAIAGAFYPRYFHTHAQDHSDYHKEVLKDAGGHDPFSTVRIDKLPPTSNPEVYAYQIADYLSINGYKPKLDFADKSKVYAEYDPTVTGTIGNISKGVYFAICRSAISRRIPISMLYGEQETAIKDAWQTHLNSLDLTSVPPKSLPPKLCEEHVQLSVGVVVSPSEFWACRPSDREEIQRLKDSLNMEVPPPLAHNLVIPDQFCLAHVQRRYYRAHIISTCPDSVVVRLVDCGRTVKVMRGDIRDFSINQRNAMLHKVPIKIFCCKLSCIEANPAVSIGWSDEAIAMTRKFVDTFFLNMKIMYVQNGVVAGELLGRSSNNRVTHNLNDMLKTCQPIPLAVSRTETFGIEHIISQRIYWKGKDKKQILAIEAAQEEQPFQYNYIRGTWPAFSRQNNANAAQSPLRQSLHAMTKHTTYDAVAINPDDVNSILLDQTPHQPVEKFVVAAAVKCQRKHERGHITLHDTTILPQIDGIGSLVLLLFSPTVLLRVSDDETFFSGALCGLGAHSENLISIMPELDMGVVFSYMIDPLDINTINEIRYGICKLMTGKPEDLKGIQKTVTDQLQALLQRVRVKIDKEYSNNTYDWSMRVDGGEQKLMGGEKADHLRPIRKHKLLPNAL